jgi:hypothetical protein
LVLTAEQRQALQKIVVKEIEQWLAAVEAEDLIPGSNIVEHRSRFEFMELIAEICRDTSGPSEHVIDLASAIDDEQLSYAFGLDAEDESET